MKVELYTAITWWVAIHYDLKISSLVMPLQFYQCICEIWKKNSTYMCIILHSLTFPLLYPTLVYLAILVYIRLWLFSLCGLLCWVQYHVKVWLILASSDDNKIKFYLGVRCILSAKTFFLSVGRHCKSHGARVPCQTMQSSLSPSLRTTERKQNCQPEMKRKNMPHHLELIIPRNSLDICNISTLFSILKE